MESVIKIILILAERLPQIWGGIRTSQAFVDKIKKDTKEVMKLNPKTRDINYTGSYLVDNVYNNLELPRFFEYPLPYYELCDFTEGDSIKDIDWYINGFFLPDKRLIKFYVESLKLFSSENRLKHDSLIPRVNAFLNHQNYEKYEKYLKSDIRRQKMDTLNFHPDLCPPKDFSFNDKKYIMLIDIARYIDQVGTNLTIDRKSKVIHNKTFKTLRELEVSEAAAEATGGSLPSFWRSHLANTIGVSATIKTSDEVFLFSVREPDLAVFRDMKHLPVSGVVQIDDFLKGPKPSLSTILEGELKREIKEELKINKQHIIEITPLAFCRELARGGKPQFFYHCEIDLSSKDVIQLSNAGKKSEEFSLVGSDTTYIADKSFDLEYRGFKGLFSQIRDKYSQDKSRKKKLNLWQQWKRVLKKEPLSSLELIANTYYMGKYLGKI